MPSITSCVLRSHASSETYPCHSLIETPPVVEQVQPPQLQGLDLMWSAYKWQRQTASSGMYPGLFITLTSQWHIPDETGRGSVRQEDGERGDGSKTWTSAVAVTGPANCLALCLCSNPPLPPPCQRSGPAALFRLQMSLCCLALAAITPSKFRTWVQAPNTGQGSWLGEDKLRAYLVLPSGWPSTRLVSGIRPAEGVGALLRRDVLEKKSYS